jgi:hypothetical protein
MESDVNEMIGDLLKEELQLVLTRVLVNDPTQTVSVKKQLVQVFKNRQRVTPPSESDLKTYQNLTQTFRQLQQQILFNAPRAMGSPGQVSGGGIAPSFGGASQLPFQVEDDFGGAYNGGGMMVSGTGGAVNLNVIRRKIKDAFLAASNSRFNKRGRYGEEARMTYSLDTMVIRQEKEKGKEMIIGKHSGNDVERVENTRTGLSILEAITSEFVNRGNELGEDNVSGYREMLNELANDWVEVFLHQDLPIAQIERDEYAKKLFEWDTSASEEEGTFNIARASARLGWDNVHLQQVLRGEHIGKFVEPKSLTIARLNQLERDERYQEGVNLARAVDLDFYAAKFLLKLNKTAEAEQAALKIEDHEKVFSIAQVARASDVDVAFNLVIRVLAIYAKDSAERNVLEWASDINDRTIWLVDLAISSKKVDQLVAKCEESVKHKYIQYQIAKILKEREQYPAALTLGKHVLVPYPTTGHSSRAPTQQPQVTFGGTVMASPSLPNNNADVPSLVPKDLATWLWNLVHEMVILDVTGDDSHDELLNGVVDHILNNVEDINQLVQLLQTMNLKREYTQVVTVGTKAFERIAEQRAAELELQKVLISAYINARQEEKHLYGNINVPAVLPNPEQQQQPAQASASSVSSPTIPIVQPYADITSRPEFALLVKSGTLLTSNILTPTLQINHSHNAKWDTFILDISQQMINAALDSRVTFVASVTIGTQTFRPVKAMSDDDVRRILGQILSQMTNIDSLFHFCRNTLQNRGAEMHSLTLRALDAAHARIDTIVAEKVKRDAIMLELLQLRQEHQEITNNPNSSNAKKLQQLVTRINELDYASRVYNLESQNTNYEASQYENYHVQVSNQAITAALDAKSPLLILDESKRLPDDEVQAHIDRHLNYINGPASLQSLCETVARRNEYELVVCIAERAHAIIEDFVRAKEERTRLEVPLQILQQEQSDLATRKQQVLPAEKQKEMRRLEKALADLPPLKSYIDGNNMDQYENQHGQIALSVIRAALASKVPPPQPTSFGFGQQQQQPVIEHKPMSDERIRQVLDQNLKYVKSPANLIQLANILNNEHELCLYVGEICMNRLKELAREKEARRTPFLKYQRLLEEQGKLALLKKSLPADKQQELNNYVLENSLQSYLIPRYADQGYEQLDNQTKQINETILRALLRQKVLIVSELERIKAQELLHVKDESVMDEADEGESHEEARKKLLNEQRKELDKHIVAVVDRVLEFVRNPYHLQSIGDRELKANGEYALVLRVGEHTQGAIEQLNTERQEREKIRSQLAELEQEDEEIKELRKQSKNKGKKMDDEKMALMEELQLKVSLMNESPSYQNLTAVDLADCHFNISSMMISAAVEARDTEDQKLELSINSATSEEQQKERQQERDRINREHDKRIESVVDRCIVYVRHPQYVLQLLENMKRRNKKTSVSSVISGDEDENANNDLSLVLKLGRRVVDECLICEEKRHARDIPEQKVAILLEEQKELEVLRKNLTEQQQKELESLQAKLEGKELTLPDYLIAANRKSGVVSYDQISNWRFSALNKMIQTVAGMKQDLNEAIESAEGEVSSAAEKRATKLAELLVDILNLVKAALTNVNNLQTIVQDQYNRKEYALCVEMGKHTHQMIDKLRNRLADRVLPEQKYLLLEQEKERLFKQRKQLTEEQQNELRELKLAQKLFELEGKFDAGQTDATLDKVAYSVSNAMVNSALDEMSAVENRIQTDSQMDESEQENETGRSTTRLNEVIDAAVGALASSTCFGLENCIKILLHLNSKLHYPLVLRVGRICEDRIRQLRDQVVTIGVLEKEKQTLLSNKREDNMDSIRTQERLRQIDHELSRLPIKYKKRAKLDHFDLNVAHMMMNAAKIEDDDSCLKEQAVKIFKINMTPETFGEVKVLTPEDEWNNKLRLELLQHVLDRIAADEEEDDEVYTGADDFADHDVDNFVADEDSDEEEEDDEDEFINEDSDDDGYGRAKRGRKRKAPKRKAPKKKKTKVVKSATASTKSSLLRRGTFKERIELLLNEGMFQETIAVFPKPPKGTVDLLERLYVEIRKGDQKQLEQILPLVEEYVTRDYMQFDFDSTVSLLDLVEEHFRTFVISMCERICEKIIVNIVPKQYQSFVDFLKAVKARLSKYATDDDATDEEEEESDDSSRKKKRKTPKKKKQPKRQPWEEFLENVKTTHKGKKKLMSMVVMAFDS